MRRSQATRRRAARCAGAAVILVLTSGCQSIHSGAVRRLIEVEDQKIGEAQANVDQFVRATNTAVNNWKQAVSSVSESVEQTRTVSAVHALVFSSNQNIASKKGVDLQAAGYLIGELYLADRAGLDQVVLDQFDEDFRALRTLADKVKSNWQGLADNQAQLAAFAEKTGFASVDAQLVRALLVEAGGVEGIDAVLERSRQVNDALRKASSVSLLEGAGLARAGMFTADLVDLLERVKK